MTGKDPRSLFTEVWESNTIPPVCSAYMYGGGGGFFWQLKEKRPAFRADSQYLIPGGAHQGPSYLQSLVAGSEAVGTQHLHTWSLIVCF